MKSKIIHCLIAICAISALILLAPAAEAAPLSPALDVIAAESGMVKAVLAGNELIFTEEDFALAIASDSIDTIRITAVPSENEGTLMLGNMTVSAGQEINGESLSRLRFIPGESSDATFKFTNGNSYEYECTVRVISHANKSPVISSSKTASVWTQTDISYYGTLSGSDPDGDALIYEVIDYPTKGIIVMTDRETGDFKYTPYAAVTGTDSFSYRIRDEYGNYSETATVSIEIDEPESNIVFSDMKDHWAENAAIVLAGKGIMDVKNEDGEMCFLPDEEVSRIDFLKMAMDTLGADNVPLIDKTIFADNDDIPKELRGYVAAAYSLGIVHGIQEDTGLYFKPSASITRSEAAVILNNIIGADIPTSIPVFADSDTVPGWAKGAIYALNSIGIFNTTGSGKISACDVMTRAQTAQLLFAVDRTIK